MFIFVLKRTLPARLIFQRYTKFEFVPPGQISLADYNHLRSNYKGYLDNVTSPDRETFLKNYKFKIFLGPAILLLCFLTWEQILEFGKDWIVVVYIVLTIIGIKCLGYIFSALSIWDNIQHKKRFYKKIKGLIDQSTDYTDFQKRLTTWKKQKDLGFTGRLTYKILMSLRGKSG